MRAKVIIIGLCAMLISSISYASPSFKDVGADHWASQSINDLAGKGIITGYDDGSFKPSNTITRAELATILVRAGGLKSKKDEFEIEYTDVSADAWYAANIEAAEEYLIGDIQNGKHVYEPEREATREEMTTAVVRLLGYSLVDSKLAYVDRFKDKDEIWTGFIPYVSIAAEKGIISGYKDNTFRPKIPVSRAEAAYIIWIAYGEGAKLQAYEPSGVNPQVKKFEEDWNTIDSDELSIALSFADSSNGSITFFSEGEGTTIPFTYFQNKTDSIVIHLEEDEKSTNMILALQDDNTVNMEVVLGDTYILKRVAANGDSTSSAVESSLDLSAFDGEWWDKDKVFGFEIKATGPDSGTIEYIDRFSITEPFKIVSSNAKSIVIQIGGSMKEVSLTLFTQDTLMYIDGMLTFDMSRK